MFWWIHDPVKKLSSDCEIGEFKNAVIKEIVVIGLIDSSLRGK